MRTRYKWFIRTGLLAVGFAGMLFAIGDMFIPQEGTMFQATEDPEAFADLVTTENFKIWAFRGLIGVPLEVIGTVALFLGLTGTSREYLGFWGMLLCILGDLFGISMFVVAYYIFPAVGNLIAEGMKSVSSVAAVGPMMPLFALSMVATLIGLILFAISIWNARERFPRWSGILAVVGFGLLLVQTSYVIQILANLTWGGAYFWMAIYSWNRLDEPDVPRV